MIKNLLNSLLTGVGFKKISNPKYKKTDFKNFLVLLNPGAIILTRKRNPDFWQRAAQCLTKSSWQHALLYIGEYHAQFMRQKYPSFFDKNPKPLLAEIVEASDEGIVCKSLEEYNNDDDVQMVAWQKDFFRHEVETIAKRAYHALGQPYDNLEYYSHAIPVLPDDKKKYTCSSFVAYCHGLPIKKATPAALNRYCMPRLKWQYIKYNW